MTNQRHTLIDIIRSVILIPIISFHLHEIFFINDFSLLNNSGVGNSILEFICRSVSYAGFIIVFTYFFLLGHKKKPISNKKFIYILCGVFTLSVIAGVFLYNKVLLEWDIYHFLLLAVFSIWILGPKLKGGVFETLALGTLTMLPYQDFLYLQGVAKMILTGDCSTYQSLWPVFPNIFLVLFAFSFGKFCTGKNNLNPKTINLILIMSLAGFIFITYNYFFNTPPGYEFGCYVHQTPFIYWSVFVFSSSLLFLTSIQSFLNKHLQKTPLRILSKLYWNKNFGLSYLVHWVYIIILSQFSVYIVKNPNYFFLTPVFVFMITELTVKKMSMQWEL